MDFGLFFLMQRDEQWSEQAVYDSGLEQMLAAEALGYSLGLDRRAPLQRLRPLPGAAGAGLLRGRPHHHPAPRHGREPAAAAPPGGPGRVARGAGRGERRPARRGHRPRRHAAGLPDLPVRPRRQPGARRGGHRADAAVAGAARRSTSRAASTPPSASTCARGPSSVRTRRCSSPANSEDSVLLGRAPRACPRSRRSSCRWPELQRRHQLYREASLAAGRSLAEIEALEAQSWGMRVVHVAPDSRRGAARHRGARSWATSGKMAVLRSDATGGSVPSSFDRSLLRLRAFREYLDDGWALHRHARRGARRAAAVSARPPATSACCC